jgi:hypothetical protein
MAGEDKEVGHDASGRVDASKLSQPDVTKSGAASGGATHSAESEWTASDKRGALNEVGATPVAEGAHVASSAAGEPVHNVFKEASPTDAATPHAATAASEASIAPRKSSVWPLAAGIVLGAAIGAGSAYYVYTSSAGDAVTAQQMAALNGRVDALDKRPDPQQTVAPLKASIAELAAKVAAIEALARSKPTAGSAAPQGSNATQAQQPATAAAPDPNVAALQQKLAALQAALGTLQQQAASASDVKAAQSKIAAVETAVTDVQKQAAATQGDVQSLRSGQKSLEGKITSAPALAVVADSLVEQINRGLPFAPQVNALDSLGVDPANIAVLRQFADQGVPSAAVLAAKFEPLTDDLLSAGYKAKPNASFWDRMKQGAGSLVSIHRVDNVDGTDTPSRVARIKADLGRNDVLDAVATWNLLPPEAKAKPDAAAWGALAKTHADAKTAANAVEHDAIAALGTKKS